jgi:hypothetical protein
MNITFPSDTKNVIDAIRTAIGRPVTFVSESKIPCSACSIDPTTDTSVNVFCLSCSGVGYIITYSGIIISGHVTQGPIDGMQWATGGQYFDGDCRVQIEYTQSNITVVDNATYVVVDNKKFDVRKKILRGIKEINRILVDLIERK